MVTHTLTSLAEILREHADDPDLLELLPEPTDEREFLLLEESADHQVWLISWPPGARAGWHDHGTAAGAWTVLKGKLREQNWLGGLSLADVTHNTIRLYAAGHVHDVQNRTDEWALSLHVYSPRLDAMNHYEFLGDRIRLYSAEPGRS